jgi:tetratricopeptide (TPR) repeat protein
MKRIPIYLLAAVLSLATAAQADIASRAKLMDGLFVRLRHAEDAQTAAPLRAMIGALWSHSGSPTSDLLMSRAESALRADAGEIAARLLDKVVLLSPEWGQAWRRRAQSALEAGDRDGALRDLSRALIVEPRDFLAMRQLSELLRDRSKTEALDLLRRAAELDPQDQTLAHEVEVLADEVEGRGI